MIFDGTGLGAGGGEQDGGVRGTGSGIPDMGMGFQRRGGVPDMGIGFQSGMVFQTWGWGSRHGVWGSRHGDGVAGQVVVFQTWGWGSRQGDGDLGNRVWTIEFGVNHEKLTMLPIKAYIKMC